MGVGRAGDDLVEKEELSLRTNWIQKFKKQLENQI